jgi:hypothetical protein
VTSTGPIGVAQADKAAAAVSSNAAERESFRIDEIWVRKRADASPIDWPVNGG